MLDRTCVFYGTNMRSANGLSIANLPELIARGGFDHGQDRTFEWKNNYSLSNLEASRLQRVGIKVEEFSSDTGKRRGLEMV